MKIKKIKSRKIYLNTFFAILFIAAGWWLNNRFSQNDNAGWHRETPSVQVKKLSRQDVSAKKKYIAQVSGYTEEIKFTNGTEVKKGDVLFVIEQRRYKNNLKAAEATVKQLKAEYKRKVSLHNDRFVSDKDLEVAESNLKNAEAAEDLARLNLEYTEVKSPIDGVIGKALVTVGNLVSQNTQKLARVVQIKPIRVGFSVTDKERSAFKQKLATAEDVFVDVVLPNGEIETEPAKNLFFQQ